MSLELEYLKQIVEEKESEAKLNLARTLRAFAHYRPDNLTVVIKHPTNGKMTTVADLLKFRQDNLRKAEEAKKWLSGLGAALKEAEISKKRLDSMFPATYDSVRRNQNHGI